VNFEYRTQLIEYRIRLPLVLSQAFLNNCAAGGAVSNGNRDRLRSASLPTLNIYLLALERGTETVQRIL